MLKSMTGYGSKKSQIPGTRGASVELKSSNHKYLEIVLHMPDGFLSLEDRIKRLIEARIRRGRVICRLNLAISKETEPCVNRKLLLRYHSELRSIQRELHLENRVSSETLINLPGVLSLNEKETVGSNSLWLHLKRVLTGALAELVRTREKEGRALFRHLKKEALGMKRILVLLETRFKRVIKRRSAMIVNDEERAAFQKTSDITEEIERLKFHVKNFISRLSQDGPAGKELDFIAQEMQRETNTAGAKSCDSLISGRVIQLKSRIEKIREQAQNVE